MPSVPLPEMLLSVTVYSLPEPLTATVPAAVPDVRSVTSAAVRLLEAKLTSA